ncbi:endolytic transglycosylase MltG [uncultured Jatrophihabitans sp.]|uniref:endolytic transglycosylase MltG n=1 Tax=uncultured Jatrophihabitans sp. TaxID=1610747 RepID=UPI0035CA06D6
MSQRDRESTTGSHSSAGHRADGTAHDAEQFSETEGDSSFFDGYAATEYDDPPGRTRGSRRDRDPAPDADGRVARNRRRRNRRVFAILIPLLVVVVVAAVWFIAVPLYHYFSPSDYSGSGSGAVIVTVRADDDATAIGATLRKAGVVASVKAFTNAASDNAKSQTIQAGSYRLRKHMSATSAVSLLLSPSARVNADVLVIEGATILDVQKRLTAAPCTASSPKDAQCGPGMSVAAVRVAFAHASTLGLPSDYTVDGKTPTSVEGFLYPATYYFADKTAPADALQAMISKFTDEARQTDFTASAKALGITPYQELIIASIAQAEAKFPADFAKVARVILNRLAAKMPLQIDATSAYAAKLRGLDPAKVIYKDIPGPYNTYNTDGLPPTPIGNPGAEALTGAAQPAKGDWLYYVNADAAGHLGFYSTDKQFEAARVKCEANHWGCG